MKITVGIPTYNRPSWMLNTIQEVLKQNEASILEIIIVDQTRPDLIDQHLKRSISEVCSNNLIRYFYVGKPSLSLARNKIIKEAKGDIIVWLDDDVLLPKNFFKEHMNAYLDSNVIACAGQCFNRLTNIKPEDINFSNYRSLTEPSFKGNFTKSHCGTMVGANHSTLTECCIQVQGCDESFIGSGYYSDADLTNRLRIKFPNKSIAFSPNAFVLHLKVPMGGCKIDGSKRSEFGTISPFILYYLRYEQGFKALCSIISLLRIGPLRKYNVIRFWKIPYSFYIFIYAIITLYPKRNKTISSFEFDKSL